jgi:hypothetical protein
MCYCFQMECRRWAPIRRAAGSFLLPDSFRGFFFFAFSFGYLAWTVGLTGWAWLSELCRDAGMLLFNSTTNENSQLIRHRIVEYATREQAQNAVNTLSNQNLMGRLVYVREVRYGLYIVQENLWLTFSEGP